MKPISGGSYFILYVLISLIAFAAISWPMSQRSMEASTLYPILSVSAAFIIGIIGVLWLEKKPASAAAAAMLGFMGAFIIRLAYDMIKDPTSHNLFPIEIILIAFYSFPPALLGAWLISLLLRPPKHLHPEE